MSRDHAPFKPGVYESSDLLKRQEEATPEFLAQKLRQMQHPHQQVLPRESDTDSI